MASRRLNDLAPEFRVLAIEFLARAAEASLPLLVVETRRSAEEQAQHVAAGRSLTLRSLHLVGYALDVCLWEVWQLRGPDKLAWDTSDPRVQAAWGRLGAVGESVGLRWGGRWPRLRDYGHFEMALPAGDPRRPA